MPRKEPRIPVSTRVRLTTLATCARWLADGDIKPKSPSDLIHQITLALSENIIMTGGVEYSDPEKALEYLTRQGFNFNTGENSRQDQAINKALQFGSLQSPGTTNRKRELEKSSRS